MWTSPRWPPRRALCFVLGPVASLIYHYKFVPTPNLCLQHPFCLGTRRASSRLSSLRALRGLALCCVCYLLCVCYKSPCIRFLDTDRESLISDKLKFRSCHNMTLRNCGQGVIIPLAFHSQSFHCSGWMQSGAVWAAVGLWGRARAEVGYKRPARKNSSFT